MGRTPIASVGDWLFWKSPSICRHFYSATAAIHVDEGGGRPSFYYRHITPALRGVPSTRRRALGDGPGRVGGVVQGVRPPRLHDSPPSLNKDGGKWGGYVQYSPSPTDAIHGGEWGGYVTHRPPMTAADGGGTSGASYGRGSRRRCLTEGSIAYSERAWSISPLRVRNA